MLILPLLGTARRRLADGTTSWATPVAAALDGDDRTGCKGMQAQQRRSSSACCWAAMMAFDMGGPVNKAAYAFATGLIASQRLRADGGGDGRRHGAAAGPGRWPPSSLKQPLLAGRARSRQGATAVLGISFITEGAIPFAAKDPLRVIPALMIGSAVDRRDFDGGRLRAAGAARRRIRAADSRTR
ncbi:MAG: hypothetical protein MZW92_18350 [Comamonadaceae bacterium]|nr:hypothetical protein [Comamonadaceae bacterium]